MIPYIDLTRTANETAYYGAGISTFLSQSTEEIIGALVLKSGTVEPTQRDAWLREIQILKIALATVSGTLFLEFVVPRIGSRLDAVVLSQNTIFPIEFKVGESSFFRADINQVWDYALDLKNFHKASHEVAIVPILVATEASQSDKELFQSSADLVRPPLTCNGDGLGDLIRLALTHSKGQAIEPFDWARAPYHPTPSIIQAAQALYSQHSVEAIARNDAEAQNLAMTSQRVEALIEESRSENKKTIIFVTGVPGAGKTLVGLNVATKKRDEASPTHAVFLSGNGPLVEVLREALVRDEAARLTCPVSSDQSLLENGPFGVS